MTTTLFGSRPAKLAQAAVADASRVIAVRCRELGIPAEFAPTLNLSWWERGENACQKRRAELRRVAQSRIAANAQAAKLSIQASSLRIQEQLLTAGLTSTEAREFLASMPSAEALMPMLALASIEKAVGKTTDDDDWGPPHE